MAMPAVPAMPTREYSSAANTFSMSRWAIRLPIVARRSPAITTPPSKVAATIVVPCGSQRSASRGARAARQQLAARPRTRNSVNDDEPGTVRVAASSPGQGRSVAAHWPPFCTN